MNTEEFDAHVAAVYDSTKEYRSQYCNWQRLIDWDIWHAVVAAYTREKEAVRSNNFILKQLMEASEREARVSETLAHARAEGAKLHEENRNLRAQIQYIMQGAGD